MALLLVALLLVALVLVALFLMTGPRSELAQRFRPALTGRRLRDSMV
jgi:hypothetical protein